MTKSAARVLHLTHVALLRGINVGGKNKLPMAELAELFRAAGCAEVRTYIASGNVLFRASDRTAKRIPMLITKRIQEDFGLRVPVILRDEQELRQVRAKNPFLAKSADSDQLYVGFLADEAQARQVRALDPARSPGDEFLVRGREIYMRLSTGAAKTRLTNAWFDAQLGTTSTFRNWRTVGKLVLLLDAAG